MLVRPMLLHRMALVSVRLFCKNLGNLQEFFGQMVYRPPWQKIPRTPMFPAGVANFGKAMYRSLERSTQDTRDGFFLYSAQASFSWSRVVLARLLRRAYSRPFWITSFEFVKVCVIRFSTWESFIGFYICCYPITTILACLFSVGVRISWKKLC